VLLYSRNRHSCLTIFTDVCLYGCCCFQVYSWLGVEPPRGVLLHGPPGCGKTALAHAIATECGVPFLRVSAPEVVSGMSGESEARLRQLFQVGW
jgi:SpoVK/Ycf46/Vps4 family AAA+-type ATPase